MSVTSAGLLPYRWKSGRIELLLVHPGGPFWAKKDDGAWSIGKGEVEGMEPPLEAAIREFAQETGYAPQGPFEALTPIRQRSGKTIQAWATEDDWDTSSFISNTFTIEWPPRSGKSQSFPEVDRVAWFDVDVALKKVLVGQRGFVLELARLLRAKGLRNG